MTGQSVPDGPQAEPGEARLLDAIEEEILLLRRVRPHLEARIDRATHMLVAHLANPRAGLIRVRIDAKRRRRYLVRSFSTNGVVYAVDPLDWTCSCPDHQKRAGRGNAGACKHALSCWILYRANKERLLGGSAVAATEPAGGGGSSSPNGSRPRPRES